MGVTAAPDQFGVTAAPDQFGVFDRGPSRNHQRRLGPVFGPIGGRSQRVRVVPDAGVVRDERANRTVRAGGVGPFGQPERVSRKGHCATGDGDVTVDVLGVGTRGGKAEHHSTVSQTSQRLAGACNVRVKDFQQEAMGDGACIWFSLAKH